jgi:chemotaxis family two-component system sensor kinase Cph1
MKQVIDFFENLLGTESWPPRWYCGLWTDFHGWLYICSDLAIWAAYFVIPVFLIKLIKQRPGIPFPSVFFLFGAFILLCGLTHLVDAAMFWWPAYRLNGFIRLITACISWATIIAMFKIFPEALALKTSQEFEAELSERRRVEEKLNEYAFDLEMKNKEVEQFAYVASHDLQEPLRTISNYVGLVQSKYEGQLDADADRYLEVINGATTRMQALIKDLLDYSRIEKEKTKAAIDCNTLLKEVLKDMSASIEESKAIVRVDRLPVVEGFVSGLKSLFQNLISNAIKFKKGEEFPVIDITVQSGAKEWTFAVKDNGIGIDEKYNSKLFVIFQRLHSRKEYPGTGIGLAQCKKIIELHGGRIWVESALEKGSTFYFTLPKKSES